MAAAGLVVIGHWGGGAADLSVGGPTESAAYCNRQQTRVIEQNLHIGPLRL